MTLEEVMVAVEVRLSVPPSATVVVRIVIVVLIETEPPAPPLVNVVCVNEAAIVLTSPIPVVVAIHAHSVEDASRTVFIFTGNS